MLPRIKSISEISRVIDTNGSMPVVVMAENLEDYACKYDQKSKLINEFIAHQFLKKWGLPVFEAAFVNIRPEHIPSHILSGRIRRFDFEKPSFGLKYNVEAADATNVLLGLKNDTYELRKFSDRLALLKIALFDFWVANDDRNHNNYNILIFNNAFIPIDHSNIFDGGRLGNELAQLTEDDSILSSDLALTFLNPRSKVEEEASRLIKKFPTFVKECSDILPAIIENVPDEWCDDKPSLQRYIEKAIIKNDDWLKETINSFSELIHKFIR